MDETERRITVRRGLLVAAAAMAVALVVALPLTLLRGDGPSTPVVAGFSCPPGSTPDKPGPADGPRPTPSMYAYTTFDPNSGRLLALIQEEGGIVFWTFDVCTNTWEAAPSPEGIVTPALRLVYDVDSDRAIILARGDEVAQVLVYEPDGQEWTAKGERAIEPQAMLFRAYQFQAVYDPITGLVLVREPAMSAMWTYDVDTDTWTEIDQGTILPPSVQVGILDVEFLTYDASVDRLILYAGVAAGTGSSTPPSTWEYDIRAGRWEEQETNTRGSLIGFGWWQSGNEFTYDRANGVSVLYNGATLLTYDAAEHRWTAPQHGVSIPSDATVDTTKGEAFMTYDPVNKRIVIVGRYSGDGAKDYVLGYDVGTGESIVLLAPAAG